MIEQIGSRQVALILAAPDLYSSTVDARSLTAVDTLSLLLWSPLSSRCSVFRLCLACSWARWFVSYLQSGRSSLTDRMQGLLLVLFSLARFVFRVLCLVCCVCVSFVLLFAVLSSCLLAVTQCFSAALLPGLELHCLAFFIDHGVSFALICSWV